MRKLETIKSLLNHYFINYWLRKTIFVFLASVCIVSVYSVDSFAINSKEKTELSNKAIRALGEGQTTQAIKILQGLLNEIHPKDQANDYLWIMDTLLDIQFDIGDSKAFSKTFSTFSTINFSSYEKYRRRLFYVVIEKNRMKLFYLRGNHSAVIKHGPQVLKSLGSYSFGQEKGQRYDLLLTIAASYRALNLPVLADSYCYQALISASYDQNLQGYNAINLLHALLKHYTDIQDVKHLQMVLQALSARPDLMNYLAITPIKTISYFVDLGTASFLLNRNINYAKNALNFALSNYRTVEKLPIFIKLELLTSSLTVATLEKNKITIDELSRRIENLVNKGKGLKYKEDISNILAWSAISSGNLERAKFLTWKEQEGASSNNESKALNSLDKGLIAFEESRYQDSLVFVHDSCKRTITMFRVRTTAMPAGIGTLSILERIMLSSFLEVVASPSVNKFVDKEVQNSISQAIQLLQRDYTLSSTRTNETHTNTESGNISQHIRMLDRLSDARTREIKIALDKIVSKNYKTQQAEIPMNISELNRSTEIQYQINRSFYYINEKLKEGYYLNRTGIVPLNKIQERLGNEDVIVSHTALGYGRLAIECITRDSSWLKVVNFDPKAINISLKMLNFAVTREGPPSKISDSQFPAKDSLLLYNTLFSPVSQHLKTKKNLYIALDPSLALLPFNALLTAMPEVMGEGYDLRSAPWLIKKHAVTLLISLELFIKQRGVLKSDKPFLAFANPQLNGSPGDVPTIPLEKLYVKRGLASTEEIRNLPELPKTLDEVNLLAELLGEEGSIIFSGSKANERVVRGLDLKKFRVLAFATHGLTSGDFSGIAEPALVLTPESDNDSRSDGLLTMSEISKLSLDAGLVILSACNTAAADGSASGQGFSGLVNSFLSAGARNVLASQWPVASFAAARLNTRMFQIGRLEPGLTVSEGLQKSMIFFLEDTTYRAYAHPRFWAPFVIAGDGVLTFNELFGLKSGEVEQESLLSTRWEVNFGDIYSGEVLSLATDKAENIYVSSIADPDQTKEKAKSAFIKTNNIGQVVWKVEDPIVSTGSSILVTEKGPYVDGYMYSEEEVTGAVLRAFDATQGKERWRKIIDYRSWDRSAGLIELEPGKLLWAVVSRKESNPSSGAKTHPFSITLTTLSENGEEIHTIKKEIDLPFLFADSAETLNTGDGLILAISGNITREFLSVPRYDVPTGYIRYCPNHPLTILFRIDQKTGIIFERKELDLTNIKSMKLRSDGHIFAAAQISDGCKFSGDAALLELNTDLGGTIVFRYGGPIPQNVSDIAFLPGGNFVLVGDMTILFEPDEILPPLKLEDIPSLTAFTGDFFKHDNKTMDAFVAVISKEGRLIKDKISGDLRGRSLRSVVSLKEGGFVTGGIANGTSGWMVSYFWPSLSSEP